MTSLDPAPGPAALPPRRRGTLQRPDCRIHYEVAGRGPAIVWLHGLGGNHLSWWQQVAHFAQRFTCVTLAHRGFAPSTPLPGGPDPADYADDLAALVAELGLTDLRLVAQSMGGWTAVEYALRRPPGLRGAVLAATTGSVDPGRLPVAEQAPLAAWAQEAERTRAELARCGIHPAAGRRMAEERPDLHGLYRGIDEMNAALDKEALRRRLAAGRVREPQALAAIACPVLMIGNEEDVVMPPMAAEAISRAVPAVRAARIARAGHSAYFERAGTFNALVEEFLQALD